MSRPIHHWLLISLLAFKGQAINICPTREITASSGQIKSPNYPSHYSSSTSCTLTIRQPLDTNITFTFTKLDMQRDEDEHKKCRDYLIISGVLSQTFCGTTTPAPFVPGLNVVTLKMVTDDSVQQSGFDLKFTTVHDGTSFSPAVSVCPTRTITPNAIGRVHSPGYAGSYDAKLNCTLTLNVPSNKAVKVFYDYVDIGYGDTQCLNDKLVVADSTGFGYAKCGTFFVYCPETYNTGNVSFHFTTDVNGYGSRFILTYEIKDKSASSQAINICPTREITASSGQIRSPYYPCHYPSNTRCTLTIKQPLDTNFTFFFNKLDIESDPYGGCRYDKLIISGGLSKEFCGSTTPALFVVGLNVVTLTIVTDLTNEQSGFDLNFIASRKTGLPSAVYSVCPNRTITPSSIGRVHSPGFADNYGANLNCKLTLNMPSNKDVEIFYNFYDIEYAARCGKDRLAIEGKSFNDFVCGVRSAGRVATYNGGNVSFHFTTDGSRSGRGFMLTYKFIDKPVPSQVINICPTREITASSGQIISPNYPNNYPSNTNCTLTIKRPLDTTFRFAFSHVDFQSSKDESICYDYLIFISGGSSQRFCGTTSPAPFARGLNVVTLKMVTDGIVERSGFDLNFTTVQRNGLPPAVSVCPTRSITPSAIGRVHSPGFGGNYGPNLNCSLTLNVPSNKEVEIFFNFYDIQYAARCEKDRLAVEDNNLNNFVCGIRSAGSSVATYNDGNVLFHFTTDEIGSRSGFLLTYRLNDKQVSSQAINICPTREITASSGQITSPNYPKNYPSNINCILTIKQPLGTNFIFTFTKLDIESDKNDGCRYDYLKISGGPSKELCGDRTPAPIVLGLNVVTLKMVTDHMKQESGFDLKFITIRTTSWLSAVSVCPTRLITPSAIGRVHSPGFSGNYGANQNCLLIMNVPSNKAVSISFDFYDIESATRCQKDKLEVEDNSFYTSVCGESSAGRLATYNDGNVSFHFITDRSGSGSGFTLTYKLIDKPVPSSPRNVRVIVEGNVLHVLWLPPEYPHGQIKHYIVSWRRSNRNVIDMKENVTSSPFVIKHLDEFTSYSIKIQAVNHVGIGKSSDPVLAETKQAEGSGDKSSNAGLIAGAVIGAILFVILVLIVLKAKKTYAPKKYEEFPGQPIEGQESGQSAPEITGFDDEVCERHVPWLALHLSKDIEKVAMLLNVALVEIESIKRDEPKPEIRNIKILNSWRNAEMKLGKKPTWDKIRLCLEDETVGRLDVIRALLKEDELDKSVLGWLAPQIAAKFQAYARALDMPEREIDISSQNSADVERSCMDLLERWRRRTRYPKVEDLIQALEHDIVMRPDLAEKMREKFCNHEDKDEV